MNIHQQKWENINKNKNIPVNFFINDDVRIEKSAFEELQNLLLIDDTIEKIKKSDPSFFSDNAKLSEVAITPDFHKGSGVPIGTTLFTQGFVIPQAVGNDINCGMRFYTTNLNEDELQEHMSKIEKNIRHVFFEGGRNIPMNSKIREAILKEGLMGLLDNHSNMKKNGGIWDYYNAEQQESDLGYVNKMGSFITDQAIGFENYIGHKDTSYDAQIGSVGGGNHFVEIQKITKIHNPLIAKLWNVKEGQIVAMIHTGSVSIGHQSGAFIKNIIKGIYPKGITLPSNGIYLLPNSERFKNEWNSFWSLLHNAANFAFANRLFLGLMLYKSISDELNDFDFKLLYDAPHNYIWEENIDNNVGFIHRKGSCTAQGLDRMQNTPFYATGEPVMIPGSMGAHSFLLAGKGNRNSLYSASHGAGRQLSRGNALKVDDKLFREFVEKFKVITPIDPNRADLRGRSDILKKWEEELKKEAPYAYKDITSVIQSHVDFDMADIVAEMEPILSVKG